MPTPFTDVSLPVDANRYKVPVLRPSDVAGDGGRISLGVTPGVSTAATVVAGAFYRVSGSTELFYAFGGAGITATILGGSIHLPGGAIDVLYTIAGQTQLSFVSGVGSGGFGYWRRLY